VQGVSVHGLAEFLPESAERRALTERLVEKYAPYLERRWKGRSMPPDRLMFRIVPSRVGSWGLD
jgi:nitroimidazol reductase NimA-like FMN-containing flavoprotein (pyridoxamine 5'-phosphate oxidase superfamily)